MQPVQGNGQSRAGPDDRTSPSGQGPARHVPRALTPDDVVPRLIALGVSSDAATRLTDAYPEGRIVDALDGLEELDVKRRVLDPVAWVDAAVTQRWDLAGLLAARREREARLAAREADRQQRERARMDYQQRRAVAERWDAAVSAALDDQQLARAIDAVSSPVPGIGRRSVPVVRAELLAWAIDIHDRHRDRPLGSALGADLDEGAHAAVLADWPLPEPPVPDGDADGVEPLTARIGEVLDASPELVRGRGPVLDIAIPPRDVPFGRDLER